ncbi:hypothetical protein KP509_10G014200 [Ceratopteris richardii]|uniref:NB-ARC domain-containing protein n=1 Tax=Ceratopteris richardii TaxID=49495 RepID=A0A8T2TSY3_CERRI|nr:hypothetical protein KP509_10G014200 [Ceratopteris richardii]
MLGLVAVQKKILANLLNLTDDVKIENELHGRKVLSSRLKNINALIVLDDVDDVGHLHALYEPLQSSLAPKSAVILTTRVHKILHLAQSAMTFEIGGLDKEMSKWLFHWHAFMRPNPPVYLEEVSQRVIEACKGLPLSLKVVGSHLYYNNHKSYWEESLTYLQRNEDDIFNVLRISFDGLAGAEKEAFLDICCFLTDETEDKACMALKACYGIGKTYLDGLKNKWLITTYVDRFNQRKIGMHDQLRDMGRHIIRQERRDRAWDEETVSDILQDEKLRSSLHGLSVCSHRPFPVGASGCKELPKLRIPVVKENNKHMEMGELCPQIFFNDARCGGLSYLVDFAPLVFGFWSLEGAK